MSTPLAGLTLWNPDTQIHLSPIILIQMFEDLNKETVEDILDAPEPMLDRDETTIIYLDQKIWGQLHAGRHDPNSRHTDAYETVRQAVDDGDAICPYSIARFFETDAHHNETFKRELYELMIDLSNNFSMRNYFDAIGAEITASSSSWSRARA